MRHPEQHGAAETLADEGGYGGSGNAQLEVENEQRSQNQIEQHTRHDAFHRIHRIALEAHQVIQRKRGGHKGSTQQNNAQITLCIRKNGGRRTHQKAERCEEKMTQDGYEETGKKTQHKARGCHLLCLFRMLGAQLSRNIIARSVTEEETNRLNHSHCCKGNAYRCHTLRVDAAHEIGVGEVVHARRQHTDNRWYGHRENHMMHRGMCEERIVVSFLFLHNFMMLFGAFQPAKVHKYPQSWTIMNHLL